MEYAITCYYDTLVLTTSLYCDEVYNISCTKYDSGCRGTISSCCTLSFYMTAWLGCLHLTGGGGRDMQAKRGERVANGWCSILIDGARATRRWAAHYGLCHCASCTRLSQLPLLTAAHWQQRRLAEPWLGTGRRRARDTSASSCNEAH